MKTYWRVAAGIVVVGSIALLSRDRAPARCELLRSVAAGEPGAAAARQPMAITPRAALRSDLATIEALRADFARMRGSSEAAKGEADDLLCQLRARLTPGNAAEVVCALPPEELATPFGMTAVEAWLQADVGAASAWIASHPARSDSHAWLLAHALTQDADLLNRFCERLAPDTWAQAFLDCAAREVLRTNPVAAASLAESLLPGERQAHLVETIAFDWMDRDPVAASAWISTRRDRALREHLVSIGAQSYASTDPLNALEWLLAHSAGGFVPPQTERTIVDIWRQTAPAQAAAFAALLSPAETAAPLANVR